MSLAAIGALAGLCIAGVEMVGLRKLAQRVELPETKTALAVVGWSQFIFFPVVGWFVGDAFGGS